MLVGTPLKTEDLLMQSDFYVAPKVGYPTYLITGTASRMSGCIAWDSNSGESTLSAAESPLVAHNPFRSIRQFITLEKSFSEQLEKRANVFEGQNKYALKEKMKLSADALLQLSPDKVSLEITHEGSLFYRAIKNDLSIYLEHFLIDEFDDSDEAIVTVYKGDEKVLNYGGSLPEVIADLNKHFSTTTYAVPA